MSVLVIEDNRETRRKIVADLEQSGLFNEIFEAEDGIEGFKKVSEAPPDLVLCDIEMPRMDGLKFLNLMRSKPATSTIPIVILTGVVDRTIKLKGLAEGARDFVQIPYDPQELIARVKRYLVDKRREEELKRKNEELKLLSNKDPLTGAFNRRHLHQILNTEFARAGRSKGVLSVLMLDIDHFKKINDSFGHQAGDLVLQLVAAELTKCLREYDFFFRYGGEEFVAVLPDARLSEATKVAQRLCLKSHGIRFPEPLSDYTVTISVGVAGFPSPDARSADELLSCADAALYDAKTCGRDQVAVHGYELTETPQIKTSRSLLRPNRRSALQSPSTATT